MSWVLMRITPTSLTRPGSWLLFTMNMVCVPSLFSTRSPAYKARNLGARTLTKSEAIDLMLEDPNLMRRPLVLKGKKAILGYAPQEYETL